MDKDRLRRSFTIDHLGKCDCPQNSLVIDLSGEPRVFKPDFDPLVDLGHALPDFRIVAPASFMAARVFHYNLLL